MNGQSPLLFTQSNPNKIVDHTSPLISKEKNNKNTNSNCSSIFETSSMLNTAEEKSNDIEQFSTSQKIDRFEYYSPYLNKRKLINGTLYNHSYEIDSQFEIKEFSFVFYIFFKNAIFLSWAGGFWYDFLCRGLSYQRRREQICCNKKNRTGI